MVSKAAWSYEDKHRHIQLFGSSENHSSQSTRRQTIVEHDLNDQQLRTELPKLSESQLCESLKTSSMPRRPC
eukprot:6203623-Amphidinium_carterae.1